MPYSFAIPSNWGKLIAHVKHNSYRGQWSYMIYPDAESKATLTMDLHELAARRVKCHSLPSTVPIWDNRLSLHGKAVPACRQAPLQMNLPKGPCHPEDHWPGFVYNPGTILLFCAISIPKTVLGIYNTHTKLSFDDSNSLKLIVSAMYINSKPDFVQIWQTVPFRP